MEKETKMMYQSKHKLSSGLVVFFCFLMFAACRPATSTLQPTEEQAPITEEAATPTLSPTLVTPTETSEAPSTPPTETIQAEEAASSPEPVSLTITASDGTQLAGRFYPAASADAPLLVMLHWAPGDQTEWEAIAPWLQNRAYQPDLPENRPPWLTADWFPEIPEGVTFNILTFTFRGCEGGCQTFDREGWLQDVEAVMNHLQILEGVNLSQVGAIGASIGADGAPYGCRYYNEQYGGCLGALSLSPGGYLTLPYPQVVQNLGNQVPPTPAWCLFSSGDGESARACENASGDNYRSVSYPGSAHGMALLVPEVDPNPLEVILAFLNQTGLCPDCP